MPKKDSTTVRLVIQRDDLTKKRYDFEADSRASACELPLLSPFCLYGISQGFNDSDELFPPFYPSNMLSISRLDV